MSDQPAFVINMAIAKTGALSFKRGRYRTRAPIYTAVSLEAIQAFANTIQGLTDAAIYKATFVTTERVSGAENPNKGDFGLSDYANVRLRRHIQIGSGDYREVHIFAPKMNILDHIGNGYRLKKTIGDQIATAYSSMAGETFDYLEGWVAGYTNDDDAIVKGG